jgi:polyisoprenoid-binding protein YceI
MRVARPLLSCFAFAAILAAADLSAPELQFDPALTKVEFTLPDVLHTVHGSFALKRGSVRFDPVTGQAQGELVVDAASGESGNATRDRRMRQNILEAERYPDIVLRPDRVRGRIAPQGSSQVELHGTFAIHGREHEIVMPVQVEASGGQYHATAHLTIPYVQWGMKNPSTLFLRCSDKVDIAIQTVVRPATASAQSRP